MDTSTRIRAIDSTITEAQADDLAAWIARESYDAYVARRADEQAEEVAEDQGETVAVVDFELVELCRECKGAGTVEYATGGYWANYATEPCRWCDGTGAVGRWPIYVSDLPPAA